MYARLYNTVYIIYVGKSKCITYKFYIINTRLYNAIYIYISFMSEKSKCTILKFFMFLGESQKTVVVFVHIQCCSLHASQCGYI